MMMGATYQNAFCTCLYVRSFGCFLAIEKVRRGSASEQAVDAAVPSNQKADFLETFSDL